MSASYKVRVKVDETDAPLLFMTVRLEYDIILKKKDFVELQSVLHKYTEHPDVIDRDSLDQWFDAAAGLRVLLDEMTERLPRETVGLETAWKTLPMVHAETIVKEFLTTQNNELLISTVGTVPNTMLRLTLNGASADLPLPSPSASKERQDLQRVCDAVKSTLDAGGSKGDAIDAAIAVKDVGLTTAAVVSCAAGLAAAATTTGVAILGMLVACAGAVDAVMSMMQKTSDQQKRERMQRDFERSCSAGKDYAGVDMDRVGRAGTMA